MTELNIKSTANYPIDEIRALVGFAAAHSKADLASVQINVKNCHKGAMAGMAYHGVPRMANAVEDATHLVTLRIGKERDFPHDNMCYKWITKKYKNKRWYEKRPTHPYGGKSSPLIEHADWKEGLISIAAHEFNHIYQFQNKLPKSEVECERAAEAALIAWRAINA